MATAQDHITRALRLCRVAAAGETPPTTDLTDGLTILNGMLNAWLTQRLMVYAIDEQAFNLVANTRTYTLGPGGTWDTTPLYGASTPRPVRVERANLRVTSLDPDLDVPMRVLTQEEYEFLRVKGLSSNWATWLYYRPDFPLGTVIVYPTPTAVEQVVLWLWKPLTQALALATTVTMPPGYEEALVYNLARRCAHEFDGGILSPDAMQMANDTLAAVKSLNSSLPPLMTYDPLLPRRQGGYNIYVDA